MKVLFNFISFFIGTFVLATTGYSGFKESDQIPKITKQRPKYIKQYESKGLPPVGKQITAEERSGLPPKLKGLTSRDDAELRVRPLSQRSTTELIFTLRDIALSDAKVKSAVGERFALLGGGQFQRKDVEKNAFKLHFYSYSKNQAITILLIDNKVARIQAKPEGYQPPETHEEVEAGAEIVRRDPRFKKAIHDLTVRGIQTPSENGNRHLYILFYKENKTPAIFQATVDMSLGRVVEAGFIRPSEVRGK